MKILIACEESQAICLAFRAAGHEAFSADLQPCSGGHPEWHIQGDVLKVIHQGWDMMIGHPPCNYLSYAGMGHWNNPGRLRARLRALEFFASLWLAPIDKICLENPRSCASPTIAKYSQVIQPYYFGEEQYKTTWLWLKGLPNLVHHGQTDLFDERTHTDVPEPNYIDKSGKARYWTESFGKSENRAKERAKTFPCIANAMVEQWGAVPPGVVGTEWD